MSEIIHSSLKKTLKSTTFILAGMVASSGLWLLTRLIIIRFTTKEDLGYYSVAVAVANVLGMLGTAGLQEGSTRFISMAASKGDRTEADALARSTMHSGLLMGIGCSAVLALCAEPIARRIFYMPDLAPALVAISLFPVAFVLSSLGVGTIRGFGDIVPRNFQQVGQPLFLLLLLGLFLGSGLSVVEASLAYGFAIVLACACIVLYGRTKLGIAALPLRGGGRARMLLMFSAPLLMSSFMSMLFTWTDTLMLGRYASAEEVATYSVSTSLARMLSILLGAAGFVFAPIAGDLLSKGQVTELKRTYQVVTKWVFAATLPLFFIFFFFPEVTIEFLFERRYLPAALSLQILSVAYIIAVFVGVNGVLMIIFGLTRTILTISVVGTVINIVLNYILIKHAALGVTGAAVATTLSQVVISVLSVTVLYRRSSIQPLTIQYLKPVLGSGLVAMVVFALAKSLPLHGWMLPLYLLLFLFGYMASIVMLRAVDHEDLFLLEAISRKTGVDLSALTAFLKRRLQRS